MKTISYAITACNEHIELKRLLEQIISFIRPEDEIVLQLDTSATEEVKEIAGNYNVGTPYEYHRIFYALNKDFSSFKNNLKQHCTRDYIIFLDADELLSEELKLSLPEILELNPDIDLFLLPRINTVEGLTHEHIKKWGWNLNEKGWVNFPDYQTRIIKNSPDINWINKVHEVLKGAKTPVPLPDEYCLIHNKTIDKQEQQNNFYNKI
jgi:glycosyltransferase involved in cell wall biosynthesis